MKIELLKPTVQVLEKFTKTDQTRIILAIKKLLQDDVTPLKGKQITAYLLHVDSYRILFKFESETCPVTEKGSHGDVRK